ncbi:MAG: hypothetical protein ACRBEE_12680 [Arenicella sp.]
MSIRKRVTDKINLELEKKRLLNKRAGLLARKKQLMQKLGQTKQREVANSRQSDRKFKENRARAVCARTKKADKAMLRTVESMIQMVEKKLKKLM